MPAITVDQLQEKCRILFERRKAYEESKAIAAKLNAEYEESERELVEILIAMDMKTFKSKYGDVSVRTKEYYPVPKLAEQKTAIREYMEKKGIFENYWNIHSQSFNSWVKKEKEIAIEEGRFLNLPGVESPTISYDLMMKKI